jgi:murein DD-endopeptidase MepM/ murein hydrolase activator NlpD
MTDLSGQTPSFDPRSWARASTTVAAPATAVSHAPARLPPAAPRTIVAALAGSAAILIGGALFAHLSRPDAAPGAAPAAAESGPAAARGPRDERRMLVLSGPQDLEGALVASGVDARSARDAAAMALPALKLGGEVRAAMTLSPRAGGMALVRLEASNADASGVIVERTGDAFTATRVAADLTSQVVVRRGTMDADSFYSSAVAAGVIDSLIPDFAAALAYDFDFQREVRKGDAFEAAFEQRVDRDGRAVGPPTLLYAALSTRAKAAAVYRFAPPGEEAGWFDGDGRSIRRALLRTPVDAARVSSGFGFRIHPVLGFAKLHKGTDFAAPTGTPIYASGDATVEFAGPKGANGNFVKLMHTNGWETLYLHMNAFGAGITTGARVRQGQEIGQVGTTGRSTGPHLHYEIHVDGAPVDPLSVRTDAAPAMTGAPLAAFKRERDRIDVSRTRQAPRA